MKARRERHAFRARVRTANGRTGAVLQDFGFAVLVAHDDMEGSRQTLYYPAFQVQAAG